MNQAKSKERFTKVADYLRKDLASGLLTEKEFILLMYMLLGADKSTGIIETNSGNLAKELGWERKKVSNTLLALKEKGRVLYGKELEDLLISGDMGNRQRDEKFKTEARQRVRQKDRQRVRQKKGSTNPYYILLCDALTIPELDREIDRELDRELDTSKTEDAKKLDRENPEKSPEPASPLTKIENGTDLAPRLDPRRDLDQEQQQRGSNRGNITGARAHAARNLPFSNVGSPTARKNRNLEVVVFDFLSETLFKDLCKQGYLPTRIRDVAEAVRKKNGSVKSKTGLLIAALKEGYVPAVTRSELDKWNRAAQLRTELSAKISARRDIQDLEPTRENFPSRWDTAPEIIKEETLQFLDEEIQRLKKATEKEVTSNK